MVETLKADTRKRMDATLAVVKSELSAVRSGRAHTEILNPVMVDYYGTQTALIQLSTIAAPDAQLLTVTPFDPSSAKAIEKAIASSNLGLNPSIDGGIIRVPVPVLTEERRRDLVKHVKKLGEDGKVAIRNVRRDANEHLKRMEKNKDISQDQERDAHLAIQEVTDNHNKIIDQLVKSKDEELMTV